MRVIIVQLPTADFGRVVVDLVEVAGPYQIDYPTGRDYILASLAFVLVDG